MVNTSCTKMKANYFNYSNSHLLFPQAELKDNRPAVFILMHLTILMHIRHRIDVPVVILFIDLW